MNHPPQPVTFTLSQFLLDFMILHQHCMNHPAGETLNPNAVLYLEVIRRHSNITVTEIARFFGKAHGAVIVGTLHVLAQQKLIGGDDRLVRTTQLHLTDAGRRKLEELSHLFSARFAAYMVAGTTGEERRILVQALHIFRRGVDKAFTRSINS